MNRLILAVFAIPVLAGCVAFDPGGQTRRSLTQSKIYEWREDGGFWVEGNGPQTERFTMIEGELAFLYNEDGTPAKDENGEHKVDWANSHIAYYLHADPSADAAASTMNQALAASTQQITALSTMVGDLTKAVVPLLQTRAQNQGGDSKNALLELLADPEIRALIKELAGGP